MAGVFTVVLGLIVCCLCEVSFGILVLRRGIRSVGASPCEACFSPGILRGQIHERLVKFSLIWTRGSTQRVGFIIF